MTQTRLTDIQLVLLANAASRDNGSLLPPPESLGDGLTRIRRVVLALIRRGLAQEAELVPGAEAWRQDGDHAISVVITDAGRAAIVLDEQPAHPAMAIEVPTAPVGTEAGAEPAPLPKPTKTNTVLDLLRRDNGATLEELISATGWLPHSARAALTGLRKKGHAISRGKRGDLSCYTLTAQADA